jgi:hypothetical protein
VLPVAIDVSWEDDFAQVHISCFWVPVEGTKLGASRRGQHFAGVGPFERMGHRSAIVFNEQSQLLFQVRDRPEVSAAHQLSIDDAEDDFDLIEPGAVFWRVHETDAVIQRSQESASYPSILAAGKNEET